MTIDLTFIKSDNLDPRKIKANIFVLESESFEIAEAYSKRDNEKEELLKFSTQSIKKINRLNIPLAFPLGLAAAYPDVVVWWNDLDNKQDNILESFDENDLLDENQKIKPKYLRVIIEAYKNTGASLECSYGSVENGLQEEKINTYEFLIKLTTEEFAELLYSSALKFATDFSLYKRSKQAENYFFAHVDKNVFFEERLIMIFWILNKFFDGERKLPMNMIYDKYFSEISAKDMSDSHIEHSSNLADKLKLIKARNKEYSDVWSENDGGKHLIYLPATIAKNIFGTDERIMDALAITLITLDIQYFKKYAKEVIFDKYELQENK